jgi:hypothetical protein
MRRIGIRSTDATDSFLYLKKHPQIVADICWWRGGLMNGIELELINLALPERVK